jgi:hypothetical protein
MLIVTKDTIANRSALDTSSLPKQFLGRALVVPRDGGHILRMIVELQALRYLVTLAPFIIAPLMFRNLAMPVMQAPALMLVLIAFVELKVLRMSKSARAKLLDADEADRRLDILTFRARVCLRKIAAQQGISLGQLRLVIEQSELARLPPLTLVSIQSETPKPHLLTLNAAARAVLQDGLFDNQFSEHDLLAVNHRADVYLRDIAQEAGAVSAQTRMAAFLEQHGVQQ